MQMALYARAMLNTERHGFKSGVSDPRQAREICAAGEDNLIGRTQRDGAHFSPRVDTR
jgi:hypothetical protein